MTIPSNLYMDQGKAEIFKRYKAYRKVMMDIWEDYQFFEFYLPLLHKGIKTEKIPTLNFELMLTEKKVKGKVSDLLGVIDHLTKKVIPYRGLIEAVSATERFMQEITFRVYRDFPFRMAGKSAEQKDQEEQKDKLLKIVIDSADREEIIKKISEEKIRSIFYGNPTDFFTKDKANIGLGEYIKNNYNKAIGSYQEIVARRNIAIHNNGRVDRKYLREVKGCSDKLGQKVQISREYFKTALVILRGLATVTVVKVTENCYGVTEFNDKVASQFTEFEKLYKLK